MRIRTSIKPLVHTRTFLQRKKKSIENVRTIEDKGRNFVDLNIKAFANHGFVFTPFNRLKLDYDLQRNNWPIFVYFSLKTHEKNTCFRLHKITQWRKTVIKIGFEEKINRKKFNNLPFKIQTICLHISFKINRCVVGREHYRVEHSFFKTKNSRSV